MAGAHQLPSSHLYDVIILGATGFTGKYVVREALKFLNSSPSAPISLALAGRNRTKLTETLKWAACHHPPPSIPLIIADVADWESINRLCSETKLILNCIGPFRRYGEPVVAACVEAGCDYLDICGETEFMEKMEAKYHDKAMESGSLVVSGCGLDSILTELGFMFNSRQWLGDSNPSCIEACISIESSKSVVYNIGSFESAVLSFANAAQLVKFRRSRPPKPRPMIPGSLPRSKGTIIEHKKEIGLWTVSLPSADSTVIRRTLSTLTYNPQGLPGVKETAEEIEQRKAFWSSVKPARFEVKLGMKSLLRIQRFVKVGVFVGLLAKHSFGRWLLLTFPSIFSLGLFKKKGPSEDEVNSGSFKMWFVGRGEQKDKEIMTIVTGPEIGYITTSIILVQCALIVLSKREALPKGGTLTPGIVFGPTTLQQRLQDNGISFDVVSNGNI